MRSPERFASFSIGTFVFVYCIGLAFQIFRAWRSGQRRGGALESAARLLAPMPFLAWAWRPAWFQPLAIPSLESWPVRLLGLLALCAGTSIAYLSLVEPGLSRSLHRPLYQSALLGLLGVFLMAPNFVFAAILLFAVAGRLSP